ncbi:hypothetical protein L1049_022622 [Liquidambar formosana]|uniref:Uncharacterized protein n=1 Tax=Liquidambar formosana TaxID=63359 RepID=A0AAP0RCT9_LIQFO
MELVGSVVDKLKGFAKSSQDFIDSLVHHHHHNTARRKPIEILKRLQREAFSDLMKLRDRQDKVERILSFHKSSKGSPFQEASTHVWGEVDVLGALLMVNTVDQQNCDALGRAGIRTGIDSKLTFETTIRQKDTLVAKFVASEKGKGYPGDAFGCPLSLSKVLYVANVNDWLSAVAIPVGAQCRDVGIATNSSHQGKGLTDFSSLGPPLLTQQNGSAIGLTVRKSNVVASLAQLVSGLGMHPNSVRIRHCFSTFGQVVCQLSRGTKLSLLGLHQVSKSSSQHVSLGPLTIPVGIAKHRNAPETSLEASALPMGTNTEENVSAGSIALVLESELDESTRIGGWVEMKKSNPKYLQWGVTMSDSPENEFGWGLSFGGIIQGPTSWDHFQVEAFLKFNLGERFSLQPGLVYVMDGPSHIPALMFRSNCAL